MIDHESHLRSILESQRVLANEMTELNNALSLRKEQFTKQQGIIEYLTANGIRPEENEKTELPAQ
jgi:hypothetical protein